jgi:hypothetical protein
MSIKCDTRLWANHSLVPARRQEARHVPSLNERHNLLTGGSTRPEADRPGRERLLRSRSRGQPPPGLWTCHNMAHMDCQDRLALLRRALQWTQGSTVGGDGSADPKDGGWRCLRCLHASSCSWRYLTVAGLYSFCKQNPCSTRAAPFLLREAHRAAVRSPM